MKITVSIILALLAGLVLGSWSVKSDLRRARQEVADLKQQLSNRPERRASGLNGITALLKIPEKPGRNDRDGEFPTGRVMEASMTAGSSGPASNSVSLTFGSDTNAGPWHRHGRDHGGLRKQLETASDAWKVRSDLARAGFVSTITTTDEQAIQFDVSMAAMNLRLSNSVRTWVDYIKQQQTVTPETGVRMMNDLSSSLVLAYGDLDRTMPADWRDKAGPKFQVFDFINPDSVMPLTEVEDVFRRTDDPVASSNAVDHRAP